MQSLPTLADLISAFIWLALVFGCWGLQRMIEHKPGPNWKSIKFYWNGIVSELRPRNWRRRDA